MVVTKKKFVLLRGSDATARAPDDPRSAAVTLVPATEAVALDAATVRAFADQGLLPPTAHTLFVALYAGGQKDLGVTVEVFFDGRPSEEVTAPRQAAPGDPSPVYTKLLLVRGAGDLAGVAFPDVTIIDVTEEGEPGFAPTIEVAALGKPAVALPVTGAARRVFAFSL
jgi:hypothetical protein